MRDPASPRTPRPAPANVLGGRFGSQKAAQRSPAAFLPPTRHRPLTNTTIARATPGTMLYDGDGLRLVVPRRGSPWWRFDYRFAGRRKTISFGTFPEVPLARARAERREAREHVAAGRDPSMVRRRQNRNVTAGATQTFRAIATEWLETQRRLLAPATIEKLDWLLASFLFPGIGDLPIAAIEPADLLPCLRNIEVKGRHDTAHRARNLCGQVFRYAVATGRAARDQSADLRGALAPIVRTHHAALTEPKAVGALLRAIDGYEGSVVVRAALQLLPLTFVRPGELRQATWAEIDLKAKLWRIPAARMKMRSEHLVPLSDQAVAILKALHRLTGRGRYVFPSFRANGLPMSENAINAALRGMGYAKDQMTAHGWRATARTLLDEVLRFHPDVIESQLAHAPRGSLGDTYNRTSHLEARRTMMAKWAIYLDGLKA